MSPVRSRDRTFEREGTLDKLSELHTLQQTLATGRGDETADYDQEELETAAENLMQHLSVDQLDMLHLRFMTGFLPEDLPDPSDDEAGSLIGSAAGGIPGQDSFEDNSLLSSNLSVPIDKHKSVSGSPTSIVELTAPRPPKKSMSLKEWTDTICILVGTRKAKSDAAAMFRLMDVNQNEYVTWGQVLDMFLENMAPTTDEKLENRPNPLNHDSKFRSIVHTKRESIMKIIGVCTGQTFVYIMVSKYGQVGIYDEKYRLQRQYEIDIDTDPDSDLDVAASDPGWVTDGLWMDDVKKAVYTTSLRTMHFYDASASVHYEEFRAFGFRSIPTSIDYSFDEENPDDESLLMFGDAEGGLTIVHFLRPMDSLFVKDEVDSVQCLFWPDIKKHEEFAKIEYYPRLHTNGILGLRYLKQNNTVITISRDPIKSLVIRQVNGKFDSYVFKLDWGVRCFDHCSSATLSLLATGSNDKIVRLWNPVVTSKPISNLVGHKSGLNDVKIKENRRLLLSYDKQAVLKVWDIDLGHCLQTLNLNFPRAFIFLYGIFTGAGGGKLSNYVVEK